MAPLLINVIPFVLISPVLIRAGSKIGCTITVSEVELCCYLGGIGSTTTTTTVYTRFQYVRTAGIANVWNSYSRQPAENFTSLLWAREACDLQRKCAGIVKHKVHGFFWVETCGPDSYQRDTGLVEEVLYKVTDAIGQVMKCECPRSLTVGPLRKGRNTDYHVYMGVFRIWYQTDGTDPTDKSGHRPVYKLENPCSACGQVYLFYRTGEAWSGWLISNNGFESTFGVLRNADDDLCPSTVNIRNWQGVNPPGDQADVPHVIVRANSTTPEVPAPWRVVNEIKVVGQAVYEQPATSICLYSTMCDRYYPDVKSKFDQCCRSAQTDKSAAKSCSQNAFLNISEQWKSRNTTIVDWVPPSTTLSTEGRLENVNVPGEWTDGSIRNAFGDKVPPKPVAVTSSSQSVMPFIGPVLGLISLWTALQESTIPPMSTTILGARYYA